MKKIIIALILCLCVVTSAFSASSFTESYGYLGSNIYSLTLNWTAAADGSVTSYTTAATIKGYIFTAVTNPDTTAGGLAPTDDYDITITNSQGIDLFGGALADRDSTNSENAVPLLTPGVYYTPIANEKVIIGISNNSVNGAKGKLILYWEER